MNNTENIKILVLMSAYNGEKYIEEQIKSIFNQKGNFDIHLSIRDDGSKDNTISIIEKLIKKYDNIELIIGRNIGCNSSYFELFKHASTKKNYYYYYALSDQDDIWLESKLLTGINRILKESIDGPILYGSPSYLVKDDLVPYGTTQYKNKEISIYNTIIQNIVPGHSQIFNRQLLELLIIKVDINNVYVYDSWITNVATVFGTVLFENKPNTLYRMHNENVVGYGNSKFNWINERIKRIQNGDIKKQVTQIEMFYKTFNKKLDNCSRIELTSFLNSRKNINSRFKYLLKTKLYRQRRSETFFFKLLYLFGKYNPTDIRKTTYELD